eukprot:1097101-Pleurochrysis_carterae.AAC.1
MRRKGILTVRRRRSRMRRASPHSPFPADMGALEWSGDRSGLTEFIIYGLPSTDIRLRSGNTVGGRGCLRAGVELGVRMMPP